MMGRSKKFIAHPASQSVIDRRWQPNFKTGNIFFHFVWFPLFWFLPHKWFLSRPQELASTSSQPATSPRQASTTNATSASMPANNSTSIQVEHLQLKNDDLSTQLEVPLDNSSPMPPNADLNGQSAPLLQKNENENISSIQTTLTSMKKKCQAGGSYYCSPTFKYVIHLWFRLGYIGLYTVTLLGIPDRRRQMLEEFKLNRIYSKFTDMYKLEMFVMGWQFTFVLDMFYTCISRGLKGKDKTYLERFCYIAEAFYKYIEKNPYNFFQNVLIIVDISLFFFSATGFREDLNTTTIQVAVFFFYVSYILACVQLINFFNVDSYYVSIISTLTSLKNLSRFFPLILIFWFTYAVCQLSIIGYDIGDPSMSNTSYVWQFFSYGSFELLGEMNSQRATGEVIDAIEELTSVYDSYAQNKMRSTLVPVLMFVYMIVGSVVLINLLTALLTKTFEEKTEIKYIYWRLRKYELLVEYEGKLWGPPPICIFEIIWYTITYFFSKCRKESSHACDCLTCCCCSTECCEQSPIDISGGGWDRIQLDKTVVKTEDKDVQTVENISVEQQFVKEIEELRKEFLKLHAKQEKLFLN